MPTIEGTSDSEVSYGFGHAQAVAHASEVLELYGIGRGTAASLWGEVFLAGDVLHASLGLETHITEWVLHQTSDTIERIQAFCDGFNSACQEDFARGAARRAVLPVTPRDVIGHAVTIFVTFARAWDQGAAFPSPPNLVEGLSAGSSAWAVSARRSATGSSLLLINPHLAWFSFNRLFEARTLSPGRRFHGVALVGLPWQIMGFGPAAGWAHTVSPVPLLWTWSLELDQDGYRYDGRTLPFEIVEHRVPVLDQAAQVVVERRTVHGPMVTAPDGALVAVRIAGVLHEAVTTALEGWWQMSTASSVEQLDEVLHRWPQPMFNVVAADGGGSVGAMYCGAPPARPGGDYADAHKRLPGNTSKTLWRSVHAPGDLPRTIDPASGSVQNVNETPWWFTEPPLDPMRYPTGIAPSPARLRDIRSPLSRAALRDRDTIAVEQLLNLKWDTRIRLADLVLDELLLAAASEPQLDAACHVLRSWDRRADPSSQGYVLFYAWAHMHLSVNALLRKDDELRPAVAAGGLPQGLADVDGAVADLLRAVEVLTGHAIPLDAQYGDIATLDDGKVPASGAPTFLGAFKCLEVVPSGRHWDAIGGDSWVAMVQFEPDGARAGALLVNGNSSEHHATRDRPQAAGFAAARLVPLEPLTTAPA